MLHPAVESLERLVAFVDCRLGDLVAIEPDGSIHVDRDRLAQADRLGFLKRARVGRREGDPDAVDSVEVELFDKYPALDLLLAYCDARDARLAFEASRAPSLAGDAPTIEIPTSPSCSPTPAPPVVRERCA